jgi:hypothetical protein
MGDAELANQARSLKSIDHTLKELVKVVATMNENLVVAIKTVTHLFEEWEKLSSEADDKPSFKKVRSKTFGLEGVVVREDENGNTLILIEGVDLKWFPNDDLEEVE